VADAATSNVKPGTGRRRGHEQGKSLITVERFPIRLALRHTPRKPTRPPLLMRTKFVPPTGYSRTTRQLRPVFSFYTDTHGLSLHGRLRPRLDTNADAENSYYSVTRGPRSMPFRDEWL